MGATAAVAAAIEAFLAGRLAFDRLADDLAAAGHPPAAVAAVVDDLVNTGRLPADVARLIRARVEAAAAARAAATPAADPHAALRSRVEDVVTEALVDDFRRFRDRPRGGERVAERQLDVLLTDFRGLRLRRQADRVAAGEPSAPAAGGLSLSEAPPVGPGDMLKGRFVLDDELGRGGMGQVFRAVDRRRLEALDPQPYVAVKLIAGDFRRHPDALRAIEAEARRAQALAHPNICAVFDFDRDGAHAFIVMELLDGETLDAALKRAPDRRLPAARRADVLGGLLAAIAHAHAHGVVHADLKPGNVFLTVDGTAKVLDFGVATALHGAGFDPASLRALTPGYSSPEMAGGAPRDPRDDVFALGAIAYLALAGRHPYDRRPAEQAAHLGLVPAPIEGLPPAAWRALAAALAFAREARPADAGALAAALMPAIAAG
jgi:predicted Ser/Thr protein kinase